MPLILQPLPSISINIAEAYNRSASVSHRQHTLSVDHQAIKKIKSVMPAKFAKKLLQPAGARVVNRQKLDRT